MFGRLSSENHCRSDDLGCFVLRELLEGLFLVKLCPTHQGKLVTSTALNNGGVSVAKRSHA